MIIVNLLKISAVFANILRLVAIRLYNELIRWKELREKQRLHDELMAKHSDRWLEMVATQAVRMNNGQSLDMSKDESINLLNLANKHLKSKLYKGKKIKRRTKDMSVIEEESKEISASRSSRSDIDFED